jgi:5-methylcytosine-specific restriction protein A
VTNPIYRTRQWQSVRKQVLSRDLRQCQIRGPRCRGTANVVDHIIELEDGGAPYLLSNLQAACASCNASKRNSSLARRAKGRGRRQW